MKYGLLGPAQFKHGWFLCLHSGKCYWPQCKDRARVPGEKLHRGSHCYWQWCNQAGHQSFVGGQMNTSFLNFIINLKFIKLCSRQTVNKLWILEWDGEIEMLLITISCPQVVQSGGKNIELAIIRRNQPLKASIPTFSKMQLGCMYWTLVVVCVHATKFGLHYRFLNPKRSRHWWQRLRKRRRRRLRKRSRRSLHRSVTSAWQPHLLCVAPGYWWVCLFYVRGELFKWEAAQ